MSKEDKEKYNKDKDFRLRYLKEDGIIDNVTYRSDDYPPKFYQVLEKLDLIMRLYIGDEMGVTGYDELLELGGIIALNGHLKYGMPETAKALFRSFVNPKNAWKLFHDSGAVFGGALRAYSDLRQYLIDNAEKVEECHEKYYKLRQEISKYTEY